MKVLSLETSGHAATVATLLAEAGSGAVLLHEATLSAGRRTARDLAPELRKLLAESGWKPPDVSLVAVSIGPGSFTGLRIGVTTAKTFAYAAGAEVMGVSTLSVVAEQARLTLAPEPSEAMDRVVVAAIPAERRQVFSAQYALSESGMLEPIGQVETIDAEKWLRDLKPGQVVTGPALGKLASRLPPGVRAADSGVWQPIARTVGSLAWESYRAGRRDDLWGLVPQYHRLSAAEEKIQRRDADRGGEEVNQGG